MNDKKFISGLPKVLENPGLGVMEFWSIEKNISNLYPLLQHSITPTLRDLLTQSTQSTK
jgi:hypothetical protein